MLTGVMLSGMFAFTLMASATVTSTQAKAGVGSVVIGSKATVKGNTDSGFYGYGYVNAGDKHTTTTKLYKQGTEVKSAASTGYWKVSASTGYYSHNDESQMSCRVFYKFV